MKTLSLNKILVLIALFFVAIAFSNSANALCNVNGSGAIIIGDNQEPVSDDTADDEFAADAAKTDCLITPDVYKLNFYKFGLCTADPDMNDLSSCQLFFDQAAGVEVNIQKDVSATLPIPEFYIEPNTYQYLYVQLSNKLGMKWSGRMSANISGVTGEGTYCWTSNAGLTASTYVATNAHGSSLADGTQTMDCGTSEGDVVVTYEVLTRFSDNESECGANLDANGDKSTFLIEGTGSTRGIPTVNLLTTADALATTCGNAAKIAWTTDLSTPYIVTENSTFAMSVKATAANSIEFSEEDNNNLNIIASGAPRIYLTVTN